ncbi:MAG TPA: glycoside hydrolase family 57 protein [Candidatus Acidoferrum sp.]|nr:glycoside hydrolase family 57 protein [Candidatus Acidoferrum sp.]
MTRIHLVLLWHMHQPQYRDPASGKYILPWTRLHALKDYWGMVHTLREFPNFHATINLVPSLGAQLEEYASGNFSEPWFDLAFRPADQLDPDAKREILDRAFQINRDHLMRRFPRFTELFDWATKNSAESNPLENFGLRDFRDLQLLSQLAWMDEQLLATDPLLQRLAQKGADFTEEDKQQLRAKQLEFLRDVLPEYQRAAASGQIEISTTPFFHPILPLLCNTDVALESNPHSPRLDPPFIHSEDAREQLQRARAYHQRLFGKPPAGVWPSEGSVSNEALELAAEQGFGWFATGEGVLGRTLSIGFGRDSAGVPENAERLYTPLHFRRGGKDITGVFRDIYLSDLIGFVYSRMDSTAAAEDLHRRLRTIGERVQSAHPLTVSIILDGENAWEYFPGNGREFLRQFYRRVSDDGDIRALTVSEAIAAAGELPAVESVVPGSWINANFDIWIGNSEDITAWEMLRSARDAYARGVQERAENVDGAPSAKELSAAYDALLAAEGSDWCWWYGPEHSTANDAEFDAFYRTLLTEVYLKLGLEVPDELAEPIKRKPERAIVAAPQIHLKVIVDGRATSYFEWLGSGLYSADRSGGAMHGRAPVLHEIHYGFDHDWFFVRVDPYPESQHSLRDCVFRVAVRAAQEVRIPVHIRDGKIADIQVEQNDACVLGAQQYVQAAYDQILEVAIARSLIDTEGRGSFHLGVSLWQSGLPVDVLPSDGWLEVRLGPEAFSWPKA